LKHNLYLNLGINSNFVSHTFHLQKIILLLIIQLIARIESELKTSIMKTKTTLLFLLICAFIKAQSISNITISSGGSYQNNGTNSLHITIGESVVGTITNNASIHQGFWSSSFSLETLDTTPLTELDTNLSI